MSDWNIEGQFGELGEGPPFENNFFSLDGQRVDGLEAIFPIVQRNSTSPWKPIGTGFFISTMGMFATARHVLAAPDSKIPFPSLAAIQVNRANKEIKIRNIDHISLHPTVDVAIGFLHDQKFLTEGIRIKNRCFELTRRFPTVGEKVAAFGFPNSITTPIDKGFKLQFLVFPITGTIEEYCPEGAPLLKHEVFRTSMNTAPGTSGGPVAYGNGKVFAIISAGIEGQPINYVTPIAEISDLPVPGVKMKDGTIRHDLSVRDLESLNLVPFDR